MSRLYKDILQGYKEIGELENNSKLVEMADEYLKSSGKKKRDSHIITTKKNKTKSKKYNLGERNEAKISR